MHGRKNIKFQYNDLPRIPPPPSGVHEMYKLLKRLIAVTTTVAVAVTVTINLSVKARSVPNQHHLALDQHTHTHCFLQYALTHLIQVACA
jgi:hypothetical protein